MNDEKGIFLELYDNVEQTYITFKLLEPLDTLAKRAARSAASIYNLKKAQSNASRHFPIEKCCYQVLTRVLGP